jgi:hypothetical protein
MPDHSSHPRTWGKRSGMVIDEPGGDDPHTASGRRVAGAVPWALPVLPPGGPLVP